MNIAHEFRRWNFNGLVDAEISCKNGRDIRRQGEDPRCFLFRDGDTLNRSRTYPDKRSMAGNLGGRA